MRVMVSSGNLMEMIFCDGMCVCPDWSGLGLSAVRSVALLRDSLDEKRKKVSTSRVKARLRKARPGRGVIDTASLYSVTAVLVVRHRHSVSKARGKEAE